MKRLAVDLVILNERGVVLRPGPADRARDAGAHAASRGPRSERNGAAARVFVLRADLIAAETRALLAVRGARRAGRPARQPRRAARSRCEAPRARRRRPRRARRARPVPQRVRRLAPELEFFNGLGGFAADGREYVTVLGPGQSTPAPWINVVANPAFGFQVAAEGGGYTWSVNSRENQLTPWSNDPVSDRPGEAIYLRDEETGELWTPTALPIRDETRVLRRRATARATAASSTPRTASRSSCCSSCRSTIPIKISRLTLRNTSGRPRRLSVTAYVEWVLGPSRARVRAVHRHRDRRRRPARCSRATPGTPTFGARVAFADLGGRQTAWTGDRREFLGRNGTLDSPAALRARRAAVRTRRRRPRSLRARCRRTSSSAGRRDRDRLPPRRGRDAAEARGADRALPRAPTSTPCWREVDAALGRRRSARCR